MKIIINENERGYLLKNGSFVKLLNPGKYTYLSLFGSTVTKVKVEGVVDTTSLDLSVLLKDENFEKSVACINVPDNKIALHYINEKMVNVLPRGEFAFWSIYKKHCFEIIDISSPDVAADFDMKKFNYIPTKFYTKVAVNEGEKALLYFDGKFIKELSSGIHCFWNNITKITYEIVDLRIQQLDIIGQEILTTDKVALRINFICNFKICDAVKLISSIKDYRNQIYILTQLALREYIGKYKFDELLEQKEAIANYVLENLRLKQSEYYIEFTSAGIKDIILPGEIRDIMNTVLIAEKTAQANVICRREEVASTRSLLNTAKLMDENQTLFKLKELEYLEKICDKVGNISISGGNNLLEQLNNLLCQK